MHSSSNVFQGRMSNMFFFSSDKLSDEKESSQTKKIYRKLIVDLIKKKQLVYIHPKQVLEHFERYTKERVKLSDMDFKSLTSINEQLLMKHLEAC